ncbi:MAG: hypothetical protein H8E44_37370 [Planctomycetes bacterium]|nr:hypothetical protein [Planctomycetota bacterium]
MYFQRTVAFFSLVLVVCPSAIGVASAEDAALRLATFQCDVTPPLGQPIYSSYRPLAKIEHPLLAKGIVLAEGERRYVLCVLDWCEVCNSSHTLFRTLLAKAAGTNASCVAIQTVHQHTAPMADADAMRLLSTIENPPPHPDPDAIEKAARRVADALSESLKQMQPVDRIGSGQACIEGVGSTRRVGTDDGKILVRWSRCTDPKLRAMPDGRIDPYLKTITFAHGGRPLVRLHYYATHPQSFYGDPRASYDFPGLARQKLEQQEGVFQIYFTGCGGDVTAGKYNDGSREARDRLTDKLLAGMEAAVAATKYEPIRSLQWRSVPVKLPTRDDQGFTVENARARMLNPNASPSARIYNGAMRVVAAERADVPYELSALQINDTYILHLPGECMIEFQLFAQQQRPNGFVAVAAYGDCAPGYICTEAAFTEGGYEPRDAGVAPESEAIVKQAIRRLLALE